MKKLYLIGSLRNSQIPIIGGSIRRLGFDVFDDWHGAGYEADDKWQQYEQQRGRTFAEALRGDAAQNTFQFDYRHLIVADIGVLILPAGKSGHLELGFLVGRNCPTYILFPGEPERYDVMYNFVTRTCFSEEELLIALKEEAL